MTTAHDLLWRHILREKRREAARYSEAISAARAMRAERAAAECSVCGGPAEDHGILRGYHDKHTAVLA